MAGKQRSLDDLNADRERIDEQISALVAKKKIIGKEVDRRLTEERMNALLSDLSPHQLDAVARIVTQHIGVAPTEMAAAGTLERAGEESNG